MSKQDFIVISWGGIGDALVCTPTYRALKEVWPDRKLIIYCPRSHEDVFLYNPHIDSIRSLRWSRLWHHPYHVYSYLSKVWFDREVIKYYLMHFQHIPLSWATEKSVKEIVPEIFDLNLILKETRVQLFFTEAEEKKARTALAPFRDVVVMHIHSRSSVNHLWGMEKWADLVRKLPEYTFVQLGNADEPRVEGAIDWRGKTTLREALCLIKFARSFVGVDSAFSHATNAFDIPGVVLFGDSSPVYWGHDNNINIYKQVICSPCYYDLMGNPCPYGRECMETITVADVREALIRQMN